MTYFITMVSATLGYIAGVYLDMTPAIKWRWLRLIGVPGILERREAVYLILLRLSPLAPFGPLNMSLGYDVVLLNRIGACLRDIRGIPTSDYRMIVASFLILFLIVLLVVSKKSGRVVAAAVEKDSSDSGHSSRTSMVN